MKKKFCLLLSLFLLLSLNACSKDLHFSIPEAASLSLMSGTTGEKISITDPETIRAITEDVCAVHFVRDSSSKNYDGWSYSLHWFDAEGKELEHVIVNGADRIDYKDWFWLAVGSELIDIDALKVLLTAE